MSKEGVLVDEVMRHIEAHYSLGVVLDFGTCQRGEVVPHMHMLLMALRYALHGPFTSSCIHSHQ